MRGTRYAIDVGSKARAQRHPAYRRFMEHWEEPVDVSQGSRQGMDWRDAAITYAAQEFVAAGPPAYVTRALIRWLRPQCAPGRPWNWAGMAVEVIAKSQERLD